LARTKQQHPQHRLKYHDKIAIPKIDTAVKSKAPTIDKIENESRVLDVEGFVIEEVVEATRRVLLVMFIMAEIGANGPLKHIICVNVTCSNSICNSTTK